MTAVLTNSGRRKTLPIKCARNTKNDLVKAATGRPTLYIYLKLGAVIAPTNPKLLTQTPMEIGLRANWKLTGLLLFFENWKILGEVDVRSTMVCCPAVARALVRKG